MRGIEVIIGAIIIFLLWQVAFSPDEKPVSILPTIEQQKTLKESPKESFLESAPKKIEQTRTLLHKLMGQKEQQEETSSETKNVVDTTADFLVNRIEHAQIIKDESHIIWEKIVQIKSNLQDLVNDIQSIEKSFKKALPKTNP